MNGTLPESFFRDLFEQTGDLIHILNLDSGIITVNPSWLFHLGYALEEVRSHSIYEFICPEYHDLYRNNRNKATSGYQTAEIEFEMRRKDGGSFFVKGQVRMFENNLQTPYTRAVLKDITAQKEIEQQNELARTRLSKFFRHAPDAVIVIDERQIVTEWNLKAEQIFGYTYAESVGMPISELIIPARYREAHLQGISRFISTGVGPVLNKTIEINGLHKNGQEFPINLSISNVKIGDQWMFVAFIADISQRKELEAMAIEKETELLQSKVLDERKTNFLTIASHELKTPLTSIKGYNQLVQQVSKRQEYIKIQPFLPKIDEQTNKLIHLVNELMDVSKIDTGKLSVHKQPVEFERFLQETVDSLRQSIKYHPITITSLARVSIRIDPIRIEQVINNLVSNAEKYSEKGMPIEISTVIATT